ncbi:uncharacterized protein LOC124931516 [Impatiens glandulifera]|uniref:uncharacterized protein LOC124931516 n=1 Tax=Impatiens glandulifera TaxID=253017 RepID=UPI001FB17C7D|nr:uncharacterized protein LOC124931516 [Impatiens glandulifera]
MNSMVDYGKDGRKSSYYDARFEKPIKPLDDDEDDRKSSYYDARFENPIRESRDGGTSRPRSAMEDWSVRKNDVVRIHGSGRDSVGGRMRFSNFPNSADDHRVGSSYQSGYDPSYMKSANVNHMHPDEKDELLKKIDELKDQIMRSCDVAEKPRQRFQNNRMMPTPMHNTSSSSRTSPYAGAGHGYYLPNVSNSPQRHVPRAYYGEDNRKPLPSTRNFNGPSPLVRERGNYWSPEFKSIESQYARRSVDGNHVNECKAFPHELGCSCLNCYVDSWQIPSRDPQSVSKNKRASNDSTPVTSGSLRGQSKRNSETGKKQVYKPIAGGAPFIMCTNCFELLKLPLKAIRKDRTEHQVCCGACSSINMVDVKKNGLVLSLTAAKQALTEVVESSGTDVIDYNHAKHDTKESWSLDFDNSSCNFNLTDTESSNIISVDERSNLGCNDEKQDECVSSTSCHLVHDQKTDISKTMKDSLPMPLPSSDYILGGNRKFEDNSEKNIVEDASSTSSDDDIGSKCGEGSQKETYSQDEVIEDRKNSHENLDGNGYVETELDVTLNPEEDASMATEIDDSFVGYSNASDTGFDKRIQTDLSSSSQSVEVKPNVFVNGHPLADHIVKKAEKMAGPIQPGNYWYDFQAGFWGVIGHPCLGIILPFIDQFSSPMEERCANGNTGIYVNGRELNERDLDLLSSRGLPTTRNKYYVILFSGRVFDKYSGEELTSLGKLAPTVDRQKCGFGMQVPRFLAN